MSTPGEQLEALVWLEAAHTDISAQQRDEFFAAVDVYYDEHPIASRGPDTIGILHEDDHAFAAILREVLGRKRSAAAPDADAF
ncbi:MAG: hypothetical protein ACTH9F_13120 [Brachybacterium tyrofermentans]